MSMVGLWKDRESPDYGIFTIMGQKEGINLYQIFQDIKLFSRNTDCVCGQFSLQLKFNLNIEY